MRSAIRTAAVGFCILMGISQLTALLRHGPPNHPNPARNAGAWAAVVTGLVLGIVGVYSLIKTVRQTPNPPDASADPKNNRD